MCTIAALLVLTGFPATWSSPLSQKTYDADEVVTQFLISHHFIEFSGNSPRLVNSNSHKPE
jgi:hypothetical protein